MSNRFEVDEGIIIYAFRYALGKPLATAEFCANWIRFHKEKLPPEVISQICREIMVFIERGEAGGKNEIVLWFSLHEELKNINK